MTCRRDSSWPVNSVSLPTVMINTLTGWLIGFQENVFFFQNAAFYEIHQYMISKSKSICSTVILCPIHAFTIIMLAVKECFFGVRRPVTCKYQYMSFWKKKTRGAISAVSVSISLSFALNLLCASFFAVSVVPFVWTLINYFPKIRCITTSPPLRVTYL